MNIPIYFGKIYWYLITPRTDQVIDFHIRRWKSYNRISIYGNFVGPFFGSPHGFQRSRLFVVETPLGPFPMSASLLLFPLVPSSREGFSSSESRDFPSLFCRSFSFSASGETRCPVNFRSISSAWSRFPSFQLRFSWLFRGSCELEFWIWEIEIIGFRDFAGFRSSLRVGTHQRVRAGIHEALSVGKIQLVVETLGLQRLQFLDPEIFPF